MINNIQLMKNFHFMVKYDPDLLKTKPRVMAAVQYDRSRKIKMILNIKDDNN